MISVGNLCAGGAGKTPVVEHVVRVLRALGARPVVLARGYGPRTGPGGLNDEGMLLAENLPGLAQRQGPDRVASGRAALVGGDGDCLVLDDGMQHFRLARDLDVVAADAASPLSGGLRREGPGALARAGAVVLTRAADAPPGAVEASRAAVARFAPEAVLAVTTHEPESLVPLDGSPATPPAALRGRRVVACAGIADPGSLARTLRALGAEVVAAHAFPDHGLASLRQMEAAFAGAVAARAELVVVTQKDAVKLAAAREGAPPLPVAALRVRLRFLEGEQEFGGALRAALARGRRRAVP